MKKIGLFFALVFMSASMFAKNAGMFSYDRAKVDKALVSVNVLDRYVSQTGITADRLDVSNPLLVNLKTAPANPLLMKPALGIPGFFWGLALGWIGILIVYLITEDKEETKKALWGCIVGSVVGLACFLIYMAVWVGVFINETPSY